MRYLIGNDATYLNEVLERLDKLEENTSEEVNEIPKDFEEFVMSLRRSLRELLRFYKQYSHMGRTLATARSSALTEDDRALFTILADQSQRLADDTQDLLDYALQIKKPVPGENRRTAKTRSCRFLLWSHPYSCP